MTKRTRIKIGKKYHYAERDRLGRFSDITRIRRSVTADMRKGNARRVKPGYGHLGDVR